MHIPLDSVVALAHFSHTEESLAKAVKLLESVSSWSEWLKHVELHGLSGLINEHVATYDLPISETTITELRALSLRHRLAAKARYQTLVNVNRVFEENGVSYLALKGTALLPMIYQKDELRPMRDMDLLVATEQENTAAECLREIGFHLPDMHESKYMRDMHQLPNATKTVNGFTVSIELHHDAYTRETKGHMYFPSAQTDLQEVKWQDLSFKTLEDVKMLHQVCRHMESLHPGALLKLINVMDVIGHSERVLNNGNWHRVEQEYPHVINSLRCLHVYTPLPESLQQAVGKLSDQPVKNTGEIMGSLRSSILSKNKPLKQRLKLLLRPSDWWLHLYYNVDPERSLFMVKFFRHPLRVSLWLWRRVYSGFLSG